MPPASFINPHKAYYLMGLSGRDKIQAVICKTGDKQGFACQQRETARTTMDMIPTEGGQPRLFSLLEE
jgi:hypothetical protein